jgi:hypothetical protein
LGDKIEKDEVGWECSAYGRQKSYMQGFGWERRERNHLEDKVWWEDNIKIDVPEVGWRAWTGLIWLRVRTGRMHLLMA